MANAILSSASDEISTGTALYLDGKLTAVCADGSSLRGYVGSLLEPYEDQENSNVTVGFNKSVDLEEGIYFNESVHGFSEDVVNELSGVQQAEKIYKVQAGDTLWAIAQKNDLTFKELSALNTNFKGAPLTETSNIQEGDAAHRHQTGGDSRSPGSPRSRPGRRRSPTAPRPPSPKT